MPATVVTTKSVWVGALFLLSVMLGQGSGAEEGGEKIVLEKACCFIGEKIGDDIYGFPPNAKEQKQIDIILDHLNLPGIKRRLELYAANVPNAAAGLANGRRFLLYNQTFLAKLQEGQKTDWAAMGVFLHEIGHHLNDHVFGKGTRQTQEELEADWYAGVVMKQLGASLGEATVFLNGVPEDAEAGLKKSARVAAVTNGWSKEKLPAKMTPPPTPRGKWPPVVQKQKNNNGNAIIIGNDNDSIKIEIKNSK